MSGYAKITFLIFFSNISQITSSYWQFETEFIFYTINMFNHN